MGFAEARFGEKALFCLRVHSLCDRRTHGVHWPPQPRGPPCRDVNTLLTEVALSTAEEPLLGHIPSARRGEQAASHVPCRRDEEAALAPGLQAGLIRPRTQALLPGFGRAVRQPPSPALSSR